MKTLVIAEKPSVARDIAQALGKPQKSGEGYETGEYVIHSAVGHVVELFMPDDIDKKFKFWKLESLPIIPEKFDLKPIEKNEERFKLLKKQLRRKDIEAVINACDAGREGELIFTYLHELSGCKKPVKRLWMQSMTRDGIRKAFQNLRDDELLIPLKHAARCRSEADWLIGINGTRAITTRMYGSRRGGNVATVGRVQTPTLAMVLERERAIQRFVPRPYGRLEADFSIQAGVYRGIYQKPGFKKADDEHDRAERLWDLEQAERLLQEVRPGASAQVEEKKKRTRQSAPRLYDLTTLQRECNSRFGLPAGKTLRCAQALYERHKVLTYPRTDSRNLPEDYPDTCRHTLAKLDGAFEPLARRVIEKNWINPADKRVFDNRKISDHFAIIPTGTRASKLSDDEHKVYEMVVKRFIAVFYPAAEFDVTTRFSQVGEHRFKTEGKVLAEPGWLQVYGQTNAGEDNLPPLRPGDGDPAQASVQAIDLKREETRPPPRFTEATLLSAMEGAGKLVEDEELAEAMKEKGLGTPATRAQIIDHLVRENYLEREGRDLAPTGKAESLIDFLAALKVETLTSPTLTGEWEYRLNQIEQGNLSREQFMKDIADMTVEIVESARSYEGSEGTETDIRSFTDGKPLLETVRFYKSQDDILLVGKVIANRKMSPEEVRELVEGEKHFIGPLDGFISKKGKRFSAALQLEEDDKGRFKVKFIFGDGTGAEGEDGTTTVENLEQFPVIGECPKDGGRIFASPNAYICEHTAGGGENSSCDFRLSRRILDKEIPEEEARKLLAEKKTGLLEGFRSRRTGRRFKAHLLLKPDGSIGFDFPPRPPSKKGAAKKKTGQPASRES